MFIIGVNELDEELFWRLSVQIQILIVVCFVCFQVIIKNLDY